MSRKGHIPKREVLPDPIYDDVVVTKLINNIMLDGKKGIAQEIVYGAFEYVGEKTGEDPLEVFHKALNNIMPVLEATNNQGGAVKKRDEMHKMAEANKAFASYRY